MPNIAELSYCPTATGACFSCTSSGSQLPVDQWPSHKVVLPRGNAAAPGIFSLLEEQEGCAVSPDELTFHITHEALAKLEPWQVDKLGLPKAAPLRLNINTKKLLSAKDFNLTYSFIHHDGLPVYNAKRTGAFITCDTGEYLLLEPLYSILELLDDYRRTPISDMDLRYQWWAKIAGLLQDDVKVSDFLRKINIVTPAHFTVDIIEHNGKITIAPRFVTPGSKDEDTGESYPATDLVPAAYMEDITKLFFGAPGPKARYAAKGKWFIVLPQTLRTALQAVHEINRAPEEQKKAFLQNPHAAIREQFEKAGQQGIEHEVLVDSLFVETKLFLSERIKCIGEWHPKAGLFVKTEASQWFPEDGPPPLIVLPLEGGLYEVSPEQLDDLLGEMETAHKEGQPTTVFDGKTYPVTTGSLKAVEKALATFGSEIKPDSGGGGEGGTTKPSRQVPIIYDHIDELGIQLGEGNVRQIMDCAPPLAPGVTLHKHQLSGLKWLQAHWTHATPGALLADDMGLGKTLQTLAFMSWAKHQMANGMAHRRPFLIVAPTGLLKNWEEEAGKFLPAGHFGHPMRAYGQPFRTLYRQGLTTVAREMQEADWVLTTYETLRDKILAFTGINWAVVAFDEAQKIKSPKAMATEMAKSLKAEFTILLTGTPVENSLVDLWCIVDTAYPGKLGTLKKFAEEFIKNGRSDEQGLYRLKEILSSPDHAPVMLRRSKDEHWAERPQKHENTIELPMPQVQADAYTAIINQARAQKGKKGAVLEALQNLRAISLHPCIQEGSADTDTFIALSARLKAVFKILDDIASKDEKALIFVEYLQMQSKLAELIQGRYDCGNIMLINGAVSGNKRQERVHAFQKNHSGFDAMILSPKAGGVGITLTAATHVIHLSRWWNPAVEDQCSDRAYRIGQTRPVTIHYPLAIHPEIGREHSFDIKLHELLMKKRNLSRTLLAPPAGTSSDADELFEATVEQKASSLRPTGLDLEAIDIMEAIQFEEYIHRRLRDRGYTVKRTPRTGDGGADGIAFAPSGSGCATIIVQCKHTQTETKIGIDAINEVMEAKKRYQEIASPITLWAVTNGTFNSTAIQMARDNSVLLFDRSNIETL